MALIGCGAPGPLLRPVSADPAAGVLLPGVSVEIGAVTPATGWSPDEARELSQDYTALWVRLRNGTPDRVPINPNQAVLFDAAGTPWVALDGAQRALAARWRGWSWGSFVSERFFSDRRSALAERLKREQLDNGWLAAGETRQGVLLFKAMPPSACRLHDAGPRPLELQWRTASGPERGTMEETGAAFFRVALECGRG